MLYYNVPIRYYNILYKRFMQSSGPSPCSAGSCQGSAAKQSHWVVILGIYQGYKGVMLGLYWGCIGVVLGLYKDNGKENGNYYLI